MIAHGRKTRPQVLKLNVFRQYQVQYNACKCAQEDIREREGFRELDASGKPKANYQHQRYNDQVAAVRKAVSYTHLDVYKRQEVFYDA